MKPCLRSAARSSSCEWTVWERDVAGFDRDVARLDAFFLDVLAGGLTEEEENRRLFSFIDAEEVPQGAFYTVGWKMAALVEREKGRDFLVATMCDPRRLLAAYDEVAAAHPRADGGGLARFSPELLTALRSGAPTAPASP